MILWLSNKYKYVNKIY